MKKTCQAPSCHREPQEELPEVLQKVGVALCDVHVDYLTARLEDACATSVPASWKEFVALREAQALLYPCDETPQLLALPGGIR